VSAGCSRAASDAPGARAGVTLLPWLFPRRRVPLPPIFYHGRFQNLVFALAVAALVLAVVVDAKNEDKVWAPPRFAEPVPAPCAPRLSAQRMLSGTVLQLLTSRCCPSGGQEHRIQEDSLRRHTRRRPQGGASQLQARAGPAPEEQDARERPGPPAGTPAHADRHGWPQWPAAAPRSSKHAMPCMRRHRPSLPLSLRSLSLAFSLPLSTLSFTLWLPRSTGLLSLGCACTCAFVA
jgi:hypothetical protein